MQETQYGLRVELPVSYEQAVEQATAALKAQGFGGENPELQAVAKEADSRLRNALTALES